MNMAASASSGVLPGRMVSESQLRLFCSPVGQGADPAPSLLGQRMALSAESTPARATDDLPTPDAPMRIGRWSGFPASVLRTPEVSIGAAEEVVGVGLGHRFEAAIGMNELPQWRSGCGRLALERSEHLVQRLVVGDDRCFDPVQAAQE